jgi:hypothetical protein
VITIIEFAACLDNDARGQVFMTSKVMVFESGEIYDVRCPSIA